MGEMAENMPLSKTVVNMSRFHLLEPDYERPIFEVPEEKRKKILEKLEFLYGSDKARKYYGELERILKVYYAYKSPEMIEWEKGFDPTQRFTEEDVFLITYGDLIKGKDEPPLETLADFCRNYLKDAISTIHILPFFPYSSDRGFAVIDFEEVDPRLGSWEDIENLKTDFKLMFDGVFNHVSSKSRWFQEFLNGNPAFQNFFEVFSTKDEISEDHLRLIVRPRTSELLTEFRTLNGRRCVWTTFSRDQVDLNYKNPEVLLKMIEILLTYVRRGADILRLDAVTYLWTELGTECVHLQQTHAIIKLFRNILDTVAPHVALITETNVPHEENISYFGDGTDEAQMVYNFALPPLVLHTFQTGNAGALTKWAAGLEKVSDTATYFNFLDSHDGIGVMAVKNILSKEEIEMMTLRGIEHGGFISYKAEGDGTVSPYEINITWYSAMNRDDAGESDDFQVKRFLASRSIALVMMGVPGIYLHSFFGSKNDADAVLEEQQTRSINRMVIDKDSLLEALNNPDTTTHKVAVRYSEMISKRIREKAFHPNAPQRVLDVSDSLFVVIRTSVDGSEHIIAITNVTDKVQEIKLSADVTGIHSEEWVDILTGESVSAPDGMISLILAPYDLLWLKHSKRD
jgi:sucrose phosphorylase